MKDDFLSRPHDATRTRRTLESPARYADPIDVDEPVRDPLSGASGDRVVALGMVFIAGFATALIFTT